MNFFWLKIKNQIKKKYWKWIIKIIFFCIMFFLIIIDQISKFIIQKKMKINKEYLFLNGFINFKFVINYGSAFNFFSNEKLFLITIAFLIIFIGIIWLLFTKSINKLLGITFIIAGAIGNLIDRFLYKGGVIDFLFWKLFPPYTIFNIADICITIGIIINIMQIIIITIINFYKNKFGENNNGIKNRKL